ncbi:hypothetical protein SUNI508_10969 [Seiridium unicorne]|uniref:Alcohol dehydrogenase-like N-terminal domain-containing protein n=1 Tax=Seiridium unicorne TaxID=138068 RepID=A0ABR2UK02_9PEZI
MILTLFRETQSSEPYYQEFEQVGRPLKVQIETTGALDSLYFLGDTNAVNPRADDEIEIKVATTGMNFKDVVIAMGQLASPYIGIECSGTVTRVGRQWTSPSVGDDKCCYNS